MAPSPDEGVALRGTQAPRRRWWAGPYRKRAYFQGAIWTLFAFATLTFLMEIVASGGQSAAGPAWVIGLVVAGVVSPLGLVVAWALSLLLRRVPRLWVHLSAFGVIFAIFSVVAVKLALGDYIGGEVFVYGLLGGVSAAIGRWAVRSEAPAPLPA